MTHGPSEETLILKAKAPRVTLAMIEDQIIAEHYFTGYEGRMGAIVEGQYQSIGKGAGSDLDLESLKLMTFCILVLANGYTVHGISACASPENFDRDIGMAIAKKNAIDQVWPLLGFELKTKLHYQTQMVEEDALGKALTMLLAHSFGNPKALSASDSRLILHELIPQNVSSNEDIARVGYEAVRSWREINGEDNNPAWTSLPFKDQEVFVDQVVFYRANPEPLEEEEFEDKLFRTIVLAAMKPVTSPASTRSNHLRVVKNEVD